MSKPLKRTVSIAAAVAAVGLLALPAGAALRSATADVTLQVVPRGQGNVKSDPATGSRICSSRSEPADCKWTFPSGTTIVLSAIDAPFSRWSTPECPGTGDCRLTLDSDTTVVALFKMLTLDVDTSGAQDGDRITSDPAGIDCPDKACEAQFDAGARVRLTVTTAPGSNFTSFPYGCGSINGRDCFVTVLDEPQSVGVKFNNAGGPGAPDVVKVTVKVVKGGNGTGRVTASNLDCGGACSASFSYGTLAEFTAAEDGGSSFDGWGGVCAADRERRCTLPIGPITLVRPRFERAAAPPAAPTAPTAPGAISVTAATPTSVTLSWGASTDDNGVRAYEVYVGSEGSPRASAAGTTAAIGDLTCGQNYDIAVLAVDTGGNRSSRTTARATTAPCARASLRVTNVAGTFVGGRLTVRFRSTVVVKGTAALVVRGKVAKRKNVTVRAGANSVAFALPRRPPNRVGVVLRLPDPQGGTRTYPYTFRRRR